MKDTANSPMVIGPGYRRDPPPKMVGPACNGDCGCSDCTAGSAGKVTPNKVQRVTAIEQRMLSEATLKTLRAVGIDPARALDDPRQRRLSTNAVTWTPEVTDALAELVLSRRVWAPELQRWILGGAPPQPRIIGPGHRSTEIVPLASELGAQVRRLVADEMSDSARGARE